MYVPKEIGENGQCLHAARRRARPKPNPMGGWVIAWKCIHCLEEGYDHQADETGLKIKEADRGTYQLRGAG